MGETIRVTGAVTVKVDTGAANALETLGHSRNGVDITYEAMFLDVPGDENGGDDGPPIDVQYFGRLARVRIEFTKVDEAILDKCLPRLLGGTIASPGTVGDLMFQDGLSYRLLLDSTSEPRNFLRAFPRMPNEINQGSKFSTVTMEWECHESSGVLYNEIDS